MMPTLLAPQGSVTAILRVITFLALIWKFCWIKLSNNFPLLKIDLLPAKNGVKTLENKQSHAIYVAVYAQLQVSKFVVNMWKCKDDSFIKQIRNEVQSESTIIKLLHMLSLYLHCIGGLMLRYLSNLPTQASHFPLHSKTETLTFSSTRPLHLAA